MEFTKVIIFAAVIVATANGACDNACSGHGTCMTDDVCQCYDNWGSGMSHDSGDCSQRICPFEFSWVDSPNEFGFHHRYSECAGRGICSRDTGECQCFDGYEGKACARTTCPNDCSGHGTCEYIQDMGFAATWNDFSPKYFSIDTQKFDYTQWDNGKTRGCVCDATYGDIDCSKRLCPYGTDVLDNRDNLLVAAKYQVQEIRFRVMEQENKGDKLNRDNHKSGSFDTPSPADATDDGLNTHRTFGGANDTIVGLGNPFYRKTFALTFKSRLNETFTTIPIVFDSGFEALGADYRSDIPDFVHDIELALLNLPNRVIDGISVAAAYGVAALDPISLYLDPANGLESNMELWVNITFTGDAVQGPQHLLVVEDYECWKGCTPMITGLEVETRYGQRSSNISEAQLSDYNSFECGRRGKCDYTSGLCSCFTGYAGDNCNTQTTLV